MTVINQYGVEIDYEVAEGLMDDDLREFIAYNVWTESNQEFFDLYCTHHLNKFGCEFELNTATPQY